MTSWLELTTKREKSRKIETSLIIIPVTRHVSYGHYNCQGMEHYEKKTRACQN